MTVRTPEVFVYIQRSVPFLQKYVSVGSLNSPETHSASWKSHAQPFADEHSSQLVRISQSGQHWLSEIHVSREQPLIDK